MNEDMVFDDEHADAQMNRREFIRKTGSGIFFFFTIGEISFPEQEVAQRRPARGVPSDFNAFLRIGENGRVTCYTGKIEMGQGPITSLAQELAGELDVSMEAVDMVMGDTDPCPWDGGTFGSLTTRSFGPVLRAAGAEAKQVLLQIASDQLKVPVAHLSVENGTVFDMKHTEQRISYGALAKGKIIERHLTGITPKRPAERRLMGTPMLRRDAEAKVTGRAQFAADVRVPGMMHAKLLRPPAHGARLLEVDTSEAMIFDGVRVVQDGDLIAVLHRYPDVAAQALEKIRATFDCTKTGLDTTTIYPHLLKVAPEPKIVAQEGDVQAGEKGATSVVESEYLDGYVAHAPIEPHAALAMIEGDKATVWASTQTPFPARDEVAAAIGFRPENVRVITPFVGGGFGGKTSNQQAVEAARLAKLSGAPVQVAWSRKEEFFYDAFRPAAIVRIRSGLTPEGRLSFWDYRVYFAGERGARLFYDTPHHSTLAYNPSWVGAKGSHPFATGPWRAPANNTNSFARESHIDTLAAQAGMDPIEFRMRNLTDKKMRRVLEAAADKFGWTPATSPSGRGYGIGCGIDAGTYVAVIAAATVEKSSGQVRVTRAVCAQDMGFVVNPAGATLQVEGCITMGLGYALSEQIHFKDGEILDQNFDTYEIPRFTWVPEIVTVLIEDREAPPQGGGEPAIIVMGGVVANAIYDAIGVRMHQMPMTPERIRAEMEKGEIK